MNDIFVNKLYLKLGMMAHISLIPKESQDPTNIKNYRLISLLNDNYKTYARIIAERLKKIT